MTKYRIDYHPATEGDLFDIYTLIENYSGSAAADRKLLEIERSRRAWRPIRLLAPPGTNCMPG